MGAGFRLVRRFSAGTGVEILSIALHEGLVVTGGSDANIRVWEYQTHEAPGAPVAGHSGAVTAVKTNGTKLVSASSDRSVKVFRIEEGQTAEPLGTLRMHKKEITCMHMLLNTVVTGSRDKTVAVWDVSGDLRCVCVLEGHARCARVAIMSIDIFRKKGGVVVWWVRGCFFCLFVCLFVCFLLLFVSRKTEVLMLVPVQAGLDGVFRRPRDPVRVGRRRGARL